MLNHDVEFSMIENAIDFIESGLNSVLLEDQMESKYAILHLHAGITLFLKDVLSKEHWSLIFQNVDNANREDLISGNIQTVNYKTLKSRLKQITDFNIGEDFIDSLDFINRTRNNIEHYHFQVNTHQLKSRLAKMIHELIIFLNQIHQIDTHYSDLLESVRDYSLQYDAYHDERYRVIQSKLDQINNLFLCLHCNQETVELLHEDNLSYCYFCDQNIDQNDLEEMIRALTYSSAYDNGGYVNEICPDCEHDSFYCKEDISHNDKISSDWVCFDCFVTYEGREIEQCDGCGSPIHSGSDYSMCTNCVERRLNQD